MFTPLELIALNRFCILLFAALCVILGTVISCKKLEHQGEMSLSVGKLGTLVLRSFHAGTVLVIFGVFVALYLIRNPMKYEHLSRDGEETRAESAKQYDYESMAGKPMPKLKK